MTSSAKGPLVLWLAWALHDVEEALTFPATCEVLAARTGWRAMRMTTPQSWAAIGLMGVALAGICERGARTDGASRLYRATVAGLRGHVATHLLSAAALRSYTAGCVTALPVMLPGAEVAVRQLREQGYALEARDYAAGAALLGPLALGIHAVVRALPRRGERRAVRAPAGP